MRVYKGVVQRGTKRAAALGFPTVNIAVPYMELSGIYVASVVAEGKTYPAAAFADEKRKLLEAYLLDANVDLYGKEVAIELHEKIRESEMFPDDDLLKTAITNDVKKVREYFKKP